MNINTEIIEIKNLNIDLSSKLPEYVCGYDLSQVSKIPFKVYIMKGVLLHRIYGLSESAINLLDALKNPEAIILIRAAQESTALLYWLYLEMKKVCDNNNLNEFDSFIMKLLFGSKIEPIKEKAYNILTAIDKVDKLIQNFRKNYDILSEFVHPNSYGTFISHGKLNKQKNTFYFGTEKRDKPITTGIYALKGILLFTLKVNEDIENIFQDFIKICEADLNVY